MLYPHPAVYARGEYISVYIQISSKQEIADEVLDLLCDGTSMTVCIMQTATLAEHVAVKCVAMGLCWTSSEPESERADHAPNQGPRTRIVHCELRLPSDLTPSFKFRNSKTSVGHPAT
jgi:hypothetical protein